MLAVAVPAALASALAYGISTGVQHDAAHAGADGTGRPDLRGLLRLPRNPRWLASMGGDSLGLVLQVIALATGPVVLVAPLLVLAVPIALPVTRALGGPRPRASDYLACVVIVGALGAFFGVLGSPGRGTPLPGVQALVAGLVALAVTVTAPIALRGRGPVARACGYGALAGAGFGLVDVAINAASVQWDAHGWPGLGRADGYLPIAVAIAIGALALTVTQLSFQVGPLAASFPANECAAPVVAVVLGAALLHEPLPATPGAVVAYLICLLAVVAATAWLAASTQRRASVSTGG